MINALLYVLSGAIIGAIFGVVFGYGLAQTEREPVQAGAVCDAQEPLYVRQARDACGHALDSRSQWHRLDEQTNG